MTLLPSAIGFALGLQAGKRTDLILSAQGDETGQILEEIRSARQEVRGLVKEVDALRSKLR